jgi:uncharacterized membrane protein
MAKFRKMITIDAPVEKIFAFVEDPHNLLEIWPSLVEVRNVKPNPKGGYDYGWVYKMAGTKFEGASQVVEYLRNQRITTRSSKGIENQLDWIFEAADGKTRFIADVEYTVPVPLLGKLAEAIIVKQNERETDIVCNNLKNRMEEMETPVTD